MPSDHLGGGGVTSRVGSLETYSMTPQANRSPVSLLPRVSCSGVLGGLYDCLSFRDQQLDLAEAFPDAVAAERFEDLFGDALRFPYEDSGGLSVDACGTRDRTVGVETDGLCVAVGFGG